MINTDNESTGNPQSYIFKIQRSFRIYHWLLNGLYKYTVKYTSWSPLKYFLLNTAASWEYFLLSALPSWTPTHHHGMLSTQVLISVCMYVIFLKIYI